MSELTIHRRPDVKLPRMVLGFTGWMDGGRVSTGSVSYLADKLGAEPFAEITPDDFYIFHFPVATMPISVYSGEGRAVLASISPMEFAAVFRPHTRIEEGLITDLEYPTNEFASAEEPGLILFSGAEPHIRWGSFRECIFDLAQQFGVREMIFVGSVASPVPHTREPRLRASVSHAELKGPLEAAGVGFSDYRGPASFVTSLTRECAARGVRMTSLVADVPHYPFLEIPAYPRSILRVTSMLAGLLDLSVDVGDLVEAGEALDRKLATLMTENTEFRELVGKLEAAYDDAEQETDEDILRRLIGNIDLGEEPEAD